AGPSCPEKRLRGTDFICRPKLDECDVDEFCDGASPDCPADQYAPAQTSCGSSPAVCQQGTVCTGFSPHCPRAANQTDGTACADPSCDSAGTCQGGACQACFGDAAVAGGAGSVTVDCMLNDLNGTQRARCTAVGYIKPDAADVVRDTTI